MYAEPGLLLDLSYQHLTGVGCSCGNYKAIDERAGISAQDDSGRAWMGRPNRTFGRRDAIAAIASGGCGGLSAIRGPRQDPPADGESYRKGSAGAACARPVLTWSKEQRHSSRTERVWLSKSVILETEWVLRSLGHFRGTQLSAAMLGLTSLLTVRVEDPAAVSEALEWTSPGIFGSRRMRSTYSEPGRKRQNS